MKIIHLSRMVRLYGGWTGSRRTYCGKKPGTGTPVKVTCPICRKFLTPTSVRMDPYEAERLRIHMGFDADDQPEI